MKKTSVISIIIILLLLAGGYFIFQHFQNKPQKPGVTNDQASTTYSWEGKWVRTESTKSDYATAEIFDENTSSFAFDLRTVAEIGSNELNSGSMNPAEALRAIITSPNTAEFVVGDGAGCKFAFHLHDSLMSIKQTDGCVDDNYAGQGVDFVGDYTRNLPWPEVK